MKEIIESYFLKGFLLDDVLCMKTTGDSSGIQKNRCIECHREIDSDIKIEICC